MHLIVVNTLVLYLMLSALQFEKGTSMSSIGDVVTALGERQANIALMEQFFHAARKKNGTGYSLYPADGPYRSIDLYYFSGTDPSTDSIRSLEIVYRDAERPKLENVLAACKWEPLHHKEFGHLLPYECNVKAPDVVVRVLAELTKPISEPEARVKSLDLDVL